MSNGTLEFPPFLRADKALTLPGIVACALGIGAIAAVDVMTPRGFGAPFLYVPVMWATLLWATNRQVVILVAVCSVLTLAGLLFFPKGMLWIGVANRSVVLVTLWFLVYFGLMYRKAVLTIHEHEQELAEFIESASVGMFRAGRDGTIVWANAEQLDMLGYRSEEFVGRSIAEFCVDQPVSDDVLGRLKAGVELKDCETLMRSRDGSFRYVLISSTFNRKEGESGRARCFTLDITDRKRADEAEHRSGELATINSRLEAEIAKRWIAQADLRDTERRYRELVESVRAIMWRADARTFQFSFVSQPAETILGYPAQQWLDEPGFWQAHIHPDDREWAIAFCARATAELHSHEFEYRMIAADGRTVWLRDFVNVAAENGEPRELVGVMVDVTRSRQAEEKLRDSEDLLRVTFDRALVGISVAAPDGRFLKTNAAFKRMVGYTEDELRVKTPSGLTYPDDQPPSRVLRQELLDGRSDAFEIEKRYCTREGGVVWARVTVTIVRDETGAPRFTVGVAQDITESRQAEQDLKRKTALAQLLESLARAANEARTPGEAMQVCLARICDHGGWVLGRLGMYAPGEGGFIPGHSVWHEKRPGHFAEFKSASMDQRNFSHMGHFIAAVLRENRPVWLEDILRHSRSGRLTIATACGLRSGFAFPVSVRGNVVAFLEFYAEESRPAEPLLMEASISVGAMLARLIERAQAAAERERLATIVESSGEAIWSRAADDTLVSWNAAAERLFGWTRDEVVDQRANFLVPPERLHERQLIPDRLAHGEDAVTFETVRLRKDGTRIDVEMRASVVRDDSGSAMWTAFIAHDITERKRAEQELRRNTALAKLLESLARAVNEATTPDAAARKCLERVCEYGAWDIGHFALMQGWEIGDTQERSIWHAPRDAERYAGLMRYGSDVNGARGGQGRFAARAIRERKPLWIADLSQMDGFVRLRVAVEAALRSAFGFPVFVGEEVVAFVELFAADAREPDKLLLAAAGSIAAQLARLIERDRAFRATARLAAIVQTATVAIFTRALDGTIVTWNPGAERMLGYTAAEAIGKPITFTLPPGRPPNLARNNARLLRGEVVAHESDRMTRDGRVIDVLTSHSAIRDGADNIVGASVILQDISALKDAERALARSELHHRMIVETALDCIISIDSDGNIVEFNPVAERTFGYKRDAVIGRKMADLIIPPLWREHHLRGLARYRATGKSTILNRRLELAAMRADGSELPVELTIVQSNMGDRVVYTAFLRDITERTRNIETIRSLAAMQSALAEFSLFAVNEPGIQKVMDQAVILVCANLRVSHAKVLRLLPDGESLLLEAGVGWTNGLVGTATVNAGVESQAGYTLIHSHVADGTGTGLKAVVVKDFRTEPRFRAPPLLEEHGILSGMSVVIHGVPAPYGVLGAHSTQPREFTGDEAGFLQSIGSVMAAAIARAQNFEQVRQSREQLRALASRLHAVREEERVAIAREVHDELGQALTAMKIDIALLKENVDFDKRLPRQRVREELASVMGMIDQSIQSVRKISTALRPVLLDELGFVAAFEWQGRDFEKRHRIPCKVIVSELVVEPQSDAAIALFRIFQEALTNIVRHSGASEVVAELRQDGSDVVLQVHDNGKGMPGFSRTSSHTLGLAGMRERAIMFGGEVQFESAEGQGTTVTVRIPATPARRH